MIELKGERGKQKPRDFSTPLLVTHITNRQKTKDIKELNNTINQIDLTDID